MDKLIITIIGIALTAATLTWSTDYLTALYTNAQAGVRAQKWLVDATQVATAARSARALTAYNDNWQQGSSTTATATALVPNYLSDLPKHGGNYVFLPCYVPTATSTTSCPYYKASSSATTDATILEAKVENAAVCQAIQKIANRGSMTLPTATVSGTSPFVFNYTLPVNGNQQFVCLNVSSQYYFLYRVFLDR